MLHKLSELFSDVKIYIALSLMPFVEKFYGPAWQLMGIILISALADCFMGYLKNKRKYNEKFKTGRLLDKLKQIAVVFFVLSLANFNDPFFMHLGFKKYTMGVNVCVVYGIWQFLHTLENTTAWLPEEVKDSIKNKIKEKLGIKQDENKQ